MHLVKRESGVVSVPYQATKSSTQTSLSMDITCVNIQTLLVNSQNMLHKVQLGKFLRASIIPLSNFHLPDIAGYCHLMLTLRQWAIRPSPFPISKGEKK